MENHGKCIVDAVLDEEASGILDDCECDGPHGVETAGNLEGIPLLDPDLEVNVDLHVGMVGEVELRGLVG